MKKKQIAILSVILVAVLAFLGVAAYMILDSNNYIMKIGDENISVDEFKIFLNTAKKYIYTYYGISDFENGKIGNDSAFVVAKSMATQDIQKYIIETDMAQKAGITLTDEDMEQINSQKDLLISYYGSEKLADKYMKDSIGVSFKKYYKIYEQLLLADKYIEFVKKDITVTDEEVKAEYEADPLEYDKVNLVCVLYAYIDQNGAAVKERTQADALALAEAAAKKVEDGEAKIESLVAESDDANASATNGENALGYNDTMAENTLLKWAFDKDRCKGEVDVVESQYGYYVVKYEYRTEFEDLSETILNSMIDELYMEKVAQWRQEPAYEVNLNESVYNSYEN